MAKEGRKTVMTDLVLAKLREAFLLGCTDEEACLFADISPSALYDYQEKNPVYIEKKKQWKQEPILLARKRIVEAISKEKDLETSKWYAERKRKQEFSLRQEFTGEEGKPIVISMPSVLVDKYAVSPNARASSESKE